MTTHKVSGITLPTMEGGAEASLKEYITQNADPRMKKRMRLRDRMIAKNLEELDERIDSYQQSIAERQARHY